jgi:hypothetical protein
MGYGPREKARGAVEGCVEGWEEWKRSEMGERCVDG